MATQTFERNIRDGSFRTDRKDRWWLFPFVYAIVIIIFVIYTTVALLFGTDSYKYLVDGKLIYISPIFGFEIPEFILTLVSWPSNLTPAFLLVWVLVGFRASCYYERKVYYRSFFGNPPACAVDGPNIRRGKYTGERWLPFILNNFHRYFFYGALLLTIIQTIDFLVPLQYGIRMGNIVLFFNAVFIAFYVLSCHSFRHLVGGRIDCYSCGGKLQAIQNKSWNFVSSINKRHGTWFWISLITVMVSDFYIRLINLGYIQDIVFINF